MQFEVLGPLRVVAGDASPVEISSRVQRRLLSLLILHAGNPVSADALGEYLDLSAGALRVAVSRLRRALPAIKPSFIGFFARYRTCVRV